MQPTRTVEAFAIDRVKDYYLPEQSAGCPFSSDALRLLMQNCPVVLIDPDLDPETEDVSLPFNDAHTELFAAAPPCELTQTAPNHKRSFQLIGDHMDTAWQDEFGNTYTSMSLKGNNLANPGILEHPTASEGFIAFGLQESSIIERVLKASLALRKLGISTEHIFAVSELSRYPWPRLGKNTDASEMLSLGEYKRRIIDEYWRALPKEKQTMTVLGDLSSKLKDMTFFVSLRATDGPYRLSDIKDKSRRADHFERVNEQLLPDERPYDATSDRDLDRYIEERVAPAIGRNLARMHAAGYGHKFPHAGNITAFGGIVDLDSVCGLPLSLDEEALDESGRVYDIAETLRALRDSMQFSQLYGQHQEIYVASFLRSYHDERQKANPDGEADLVNDFYILGDRFDTTEDIPSIFRYSARYVSEVVNQDFNLHDRYIEAVIGKETWAQLNDEWEQLMEVTDPLSTKEFIHYSADYFRLTVPITANAMIEESINEVNDSAGSTEVDAFRLFMERRNKPGIPHTDDVSKYLNEDLFQCLEHELNRRFKELIDSHGLHLDVDHPFIRKFIKDGLNEFLEQADAKERVERRIDELIAQDEALYRQATDLVKPASLVPGAIKSELCVPIQPDSYWRFTEDVDYQILSKLFDLSEIPVNQLDDVMQSSTIEFEFDEDHVLQEIITDGTRGVFSMQNVLYEATLGLEFEHEPTYVLLVFGPRDKPTYELCMNTPQPINDATFDDADNPSLF